MLIVCSHCGKSYARDRRFICPRCHYEELPEDWDSSYELPEVEPDRPEDHDPSYEVPNFEPEHDAQAFAQSAIEDDPDKTPTFGIPVVFDLYDLERTQIEIDYAHKLQQLSDDYIALRLRASQDYQNRIKELESRSQDDHADHD